MVTVLALLGVLGVLFAAAVLSTREQGLLADASPDGADVPLPTDPLTPEDVGRLRFSMAARGYRMAEVDVALERLAQELADRDKRIGLLEAAARGKGKPEPVAPVREATPQDLPVPETPVPSGVTPPVAAAPPATPPAPPAAPVAPPAAPAVPPAAPPAEAPPLTSRTVEGSGAPENAGDAAEREAAQTAEAPAPGFTPDAAGPGQAPGSAPAAASGPGSAPASASGPGTPLAGATPAAPPSPTLTPRPTAWSSPSAVPAFPVIDAPDADQKPPQPDLPSEQVAQEQADDRADLDGPADDQPR